MFTLAHEPEHTKGKGMLMFFTHLSSGHKGIVCAMATEPIPVRATFPAGRSRPSRSLFGHPRGCRLCSKPSTPMARSSTAQSRIRTQPQIARRSGPHLQHDGKGQPHCLHPILRSAGRRVPRGRRGALYADRRRSELRRATPQNAILATTNKFRAVPDAMSLTFINPNPPVSSPFEL